MHGINKKTFALALILLIILSLAVSVSAENEVSSELSEESSEPVTHTVTFSRGYVFINPLNGTESDHLFSGTIVEPITCEDGGSFTVPENTVVFADYVFVCWKYNYRDENNIARYKTYMPGDIFENVTEDITLKAVWKRPQSPGLVVKSYITFESGSIFAVGKDPKRELVVYGSEYTLPENPYILDGNEFAGWRDEKGLLYAENQVVKIDKINPVFTAVWEKDGTSAKHTVIYNTEGFEQIEQTLYKQTEYTVIDLPYEVTDKVFAGWRSESGELLLPGTVIDISEEESDVTILTAEWREEEFEVLIVSEGDGTVTPEGTVKVEFGTELEIYFSPDDGYRVASVTLDGETVTADGIFKFTVTENSVFKVVFEKIPEYDITLAVVGSSQSEYGGTITADRETVREGEKLTFTVLPKDDTYEVVSVKVNSEDFAFTVGENTIENIVSDIIIEVEFAEKVTEEPSEILSAEESSEESEEISEPPSFTSEEISSDETENKEVLRWIVVSAAGVVLIVGIVLLIIKMRK